MELDDGNFTLGRLAGYGIQEIPGSSRVVSAALRGQAGGTVDSKEQEEGRRAALQYGLRINKSPRAG